jgi:glycosyltransferase involved in cell wall biosynthesis
MRQPRATYLMCESPPLFLGITAVLVSAIRGMKLIFNVSDLWPESAEKLGIVTNRFLLGISYRLEHWIYRNAFLISGQTRGIVESISRRFPNKRVVWLPNGVDFAFFDAPPAAIDWRERLGIGTNEFVILYAGIIGHAQGLDVILEAAVMLEGTHARFVLVGDGPEKERLVERAKELNLSSVVFHGNVGKAEIPSLITMCDAYVVPLKKLDLFKGAIPSKLFEPLAMGKPILLGVDGEARVLFIDEGKGGLFFEPESGAGLAAQVQVLMSSPEVAMQLGVSGRQYVRLAFDREKIHQRFLQQVESETKTDA